MDVISNRAFVKSLILRLILLLILGSAPIHAAVLFFDGIENGLLLTANDGPWSNTSGTLVAVTSPVRSGGYAGKFTSTGTASFVQTTVGFAASSGWTRFGYYSHVTTAPSAQSDQILFQFSDSGGTRVNGLKERKNTNGTISIGANDNTGDGTYFTISPDTWYLVEFKCVVSATVGVTEWKLNGIIKETLTGRNTGSNNIDSAVFREHSGTAGSSYAIFDDLIVSNSNYPGDGHCIARQGKAGTPTYDQYTKTSSQTAAQVWSETPYSATNNATNSTNSNAQTMLTWSFAATQSGHGTEIIADGNTINACKVAVTMKTGVASGHSIRRRFAGVDSDTSKSLTTSDVYYETAVFTDTFANLNTSEMGVLHGPNANSHTVEDVWMMADFTAAAGLSPALLSILEDED